MGGQGIERREILRFIGVASVAATFPGFQRWAFACADEPVHEVNAKAGATAYTPLFFSPQQFRLVEHLAEMIIPDDDTPGARDAGVAEFIDFMVANGVPVSARGEIRSTNDAIRQGDDAQTRFVAGLNWIDARSKSKFGAQFLDCKPEQQTSLLEECAYKAKFAPGSEPGRDVFQMIRDYTVVGYYTTKIGLQSLGYPGLRMVWPKMPGCSHLDDPEHVHLKQSGSTSGSTPKDSQL
jgi:hypothetical protein